MTLNFATFPLPFPYVRSFLCFGTWLWIALDWEYELLFSIYISVLCPSMRLRFVSIAGKIGTDRMCRRVSVCVRLEHVEYHAARPKRSDTNRPDQIANCPSL